MADKKVFSNQNITVWAVPRLAVTDIEAITANIVNTSGINISEAISWSDTTLPHATESDDIDDRSITDRGNATSRGANNYEASLSMFHPRDIHDTTSIYKRTRDLFKQTRVNYILVVRALQTGMNPYAPAKEGEWYSAFDLMNTTYRNNTEGDDSVKYTIGFMPQGSVRVNGLFAGGTPGAAVAPATLALTVGNAAPVKGTAYGHRVTSVVEWKSSNPKVASVTSSGVVIANSVGTAQITFSDPSTGTSTACAVTVA